MKTEPANNDFNIPKGRQWGDERIIEGAYSTPFWKNLIFKPNEAFYQLGKDFLKFISAIISTGVNVFFYHKFSTSNFGVILTVFSLCFILCFNSAYLYSVFALIMAIIAPFLLFFADGGQLYEWVFTSIKSKALLTYTILFFILSMVRLVLIWTWKDSKYKKSNKSWIYVLLCKAFEEKINLYFITVIVQPFVISAVAFCAWKFGDDLTFASYLWLCAGNVLREELVQYSKYKRERAILDI
ncbi:hypothetical protein Q4Q35_10835 [Flavivirga aquimarina]|uniref:Uncharacterized protein n=1 Tax=Flavivirga aquimarina TaxID=2027862 RepID=A0ABT8WB77_9FLAO|nr:hypothetical protein [Flavivirga aquimarina]MDO5970301.1 hypothetical protein [Flavivirga aquimarina]